MTLGFYGNIHFTRSLIYHSFKSQVYNGYFESVCVSVGNTVMNTISKIHIVGVQKEDFAENTQHFRRCKDLR